MLVKIYGPIYETKVVPHPTKYLMRYHEVVNEVFSTSQPIAWESDRLGGEFQTPSGHWFQFFATDEEHMVFEFSEMSLFAQYMNGKMSRAELDAAPPSELTSARKIGDRNPTGRGEAFVVYSSIIEAIKVILTERKPESLDFKGAVPKQSALYKKIVDARADLWQSLGYRRRGSKLVRS